MLDGISGGGYLVCAIYYSMNLTSQMKPLIVSDCERSIYMIRTHCVDFIVESFTCLKYILFTCIYAKIHGLGS